MTEKQIILYKKYKLYLLLKKLLHLLFNLAFFSHLPLNFLRPP